MGDGLKRAHAAAKATRSASPLAEAAKAIRADIRKAVLDGSLGGYPAVIRFSVRTHTASLCAEVVITIADAPADWAFDQVGDATHRTVISADVQELARRLKVILRERWESNGSTRFGFVHLGDGLMIAAA
jgi:hypothetical protein